MNELMACNVYQIWCTLFMNADMSLEVVFYRTESENEPVREWLQSLSK